MVYTAITAQQAHLCCRQNVKLTVNTSASSSVASQCWGVLERIAVVKVCRQWTLLVWTSSPPHCGSATSPAFCQTSPQPPRHLLHTRHTTLAYHDDNLQGFHFPQWFSPKIHWQHAGFPFWYSQKFHDFPGNIYSIAGRFCKLATSEFRQQLLTARHENKQCKLWAKWTILYKITYYTLLLLHYIRLTAFFPAQPG